MRTLQFMLAAGSLFFMAWCPFLYTPPKHIPDAFLEKMAADLAALAPEQPQRAPTALFLARAYLVDPETGDVLGEAYGRGSDGELRYQDRAGCEATLAEFLGRANGGLVIPACVPQYSET